MSNLKKQFTPYKDVIKPNLDRVAASRSICGGQFHKKIVMTIAIIFFVQFLGGAMDRRFRQSFLRVGWSNILHTIKTSPK